MAATGAPDSALTGLAAVGVALVLALIAPSGPWQPASVMVGWLAVVLVAVSMVTGYTWALAAAGAAFLVRTAIHGLAGSGLVDLALSALLLLALVELGSASLEGRVMPIHWPTVAARSLLVGTAGAGFVVVVVALIGHLRLGGTGARVAALACGIAVALLIVALPRGGEGAS